MNQNCNVELNYIEYSPLHIKLGSPAYVDSVKGLRNGHVCSTPEQKSSQGGIREGWGFWLYTGICCVHNQDL